MKRHQKQRPIKYTTMLWAFVGGALLVVAIIYGMAYSWYYSNFSKQTEGKNILLLEMAEKKIDDNVRDMQEIARDLSKNTDMLTSVTDKNANYHHYQLHKKLNSFTELQTYLLDVAVMDDYSEYIFGTLNTAGSEAYKENFEAENPEIMNSIFSSENKIPKFYDNLTFKRRYTGKQQDVLVYVIPISRSRRIIFTIDKEKFFEPMNTAFEKNGGLFFIAPLEEEPMASYSIAYWEEDIEEVRQNVGAISHTNDNVLQKATAKNYVYLAYRTGETPYTYVFYTEQSTILNETDGVRYLFISSMIILMVLGIALGILFRHLAIQPISQLQEAAQNLQEGKLSRWQDLNQISTHIKDNRRALMSMEEQLSQDQELLYNCLVSGLVNSSSFYDFNQQAFVREGFHFPYPYNVAFLLESLNSKDVQTVHLLKEKMKHSILYLSDKNEHRRIVGILNYEDSSMLTRAILELSDLLEKAGIEFRVSVGSPVKEVHMLPLSFSGAIQASRKNPEAKVSFYRKGQEEPTQTIAVYLRSIYDILVDSIKSENEEHVKLIIRSVFAEHQQEMKQEFIYTDIIYLLIGFAREENLNDVLLTDALYDIHTDSESMAESLVYVIRDLSTQLKKIPQENTFVAQVVQFMKMHYTNSSLSAQEIAEHMDMSISHLNKKVREFTEETVFSILDTLRMEHAMKLLANTDQQIQEIVASSGYGDANYFTKKFKKMNGITPSEYRRAWQNK